MTQQIIMQKKILFQKAAIAENIRMIGNMERILQECRNQFCILNIKYNSMTIKTKTRSSSISNREMNIQSLSPISIKLQEKVDSPVIHEYAAETNQDENTKEKDKKEKEIDQCIEQQNLSSTTIRKAFKSTRTNSFHAFEVK